MSKSKKNAAHEMSIRIGGYLPKSADAVDADKLSECPMKLIHEDPVTQSRVR